MKHLLVDISGHGFGHLGQTSAVLNALSDLASQPTIDLRLTIRSTLPEIIVRERIKLPFKYIHHELDKGMVMLDAVHTDAEASLSWYLQRHADYSALVESETNIMRQLKPDLVFANVTYLSLEAAANLGIPSLALCSLNWFEILNAYCGNDPLAHQVLNQIKMAYSKADLFLRPEPSLEMKSLDNTQSISAITAKGKIKRNVLFERFSKNTKSELTPNTKFILVSLGGIPSTFSLDQWPKIDNVCWIMPSLEKAKLVNREDILFIDSFELTFIDILSSADLVITKTGYGIMVEAVAHKKPIICIERGDWPEEEVLFPWCKTHGYIEIISYDDLKLGRFIQEVKTLLKKVWEKPPVSTDGAIQAANIIKGYLE